MGTSWESQISQFLDDLLGVQDRSLDLLTRKRDALAAMDPARLDALAQEEQALLGQLGECLRRREELLKRAEQQGLPGESIQALTKALPGSDVAGLTHQVGQAAVRARLLRHHSLTNWLLAQRALIHLSQLLEIIATGGQSQPTYGKEGTLPARGTLVDRAA